jgi:hypothetical protein
MDLDRQVVALVSQELLRLLLENDAGPVVWINDVVANLEVDDQRLGLEAGLDLLFD